MSELRVGDIQATSHVTVAVWKVWARVSGFNTMESSGGGEINPNAHVNTLVEATL